MTKEDKYKSEVLGQPISTAGSKLRKMLLFKYVVLANDDICYRCGEKISSIEEFSIEHKQAWLHHPKGRELYFDLNNIAFSHRECNSGAAKNYRNGIAPSKGKPSPHRIIPPDGMSWCYKGKHFQPEFLFVKDKYRWNGLKEICNPCRSPYRKQRYQEGKSR